MVINYEGEKAGGINIAAIQRRTTEDGKRIANCAENFAALRATPIKAKKYYITQRPLVAALGCME